MTTRVGALFARCIPTHRHDCDWTADGPGADKAAEKHTKTTGHSTSVRGWGEEEK